MKNFKRFHLFYSLKYIKYALLLCVLPMLQALFRFDWQSFVVALRQDLLILLVSLALGFAIWFVARFKITNTALYIQKGVFIKQTLSFKYSDIAVIETVRPLLFRFFGASHVTLYFNSQSAMRKHKLILSKKIAQEFCDLIMPVKSDVSVFEPSGAERLSFVMLSANIITSSIFAFMVASNIKDVLGSAAGDFAIDKFNKFELFLEHFLPTSLAFITALLFLLFSISIIYSILRTAFFSVCRNGGIMICHGGLLTKTERRIACKHITSCDVRITPAARLLRRYPVFVYAGTYNLSDTPVFAFKQNERARLSLLLPEFEMPQSAWNPPKVRNIFQYIWPQLTVLGITAIIAIAAYYRLPSIISALVVPFLLGFLSLLNAIDGYGRENIARLKNCTLSVTYSRFFTRHEVCVFSLDISMRIWRNPIYLTDGRSDLYLSLPHRRRLRVRGVANEFIQNFEIVV